MSDVPLEKLVRVYLKMKTKKETLDAEVKELETQMRLVKAGINDSLRESGLESVKTKHGLTYRTLKTTYYPSDWASMYEFVMANKMPELLEKRLHQGNIKEYLEAHPDAPPPGLNSNMEYVITVKENK